MKATVVIPSTGEVLEFAAPDGRVDLLLRRVGNQLERDQWRRVDGQLPTFKITVEDYKSQDRS